MIRSILALLLCLSSSILAADDITPLSVGGVRIPRVLTLGDDALTLNGAGSRSVAIFQVYVGALYVSEAGNNGQSIVDADSPTVMSLHITSRLLTPARLDSALNDGFRKSIGSDYGDLEDEIASLSAAVRKMKVKRGDVVQFAYTPDVGTALSHNGEQAAVIPGLEFKQALFGVWLGEQPVYEQLKTELLTQRD